MAHLFHAEAQIDTSSHDLAGRIERMQTVMLALLDEVKNDRDYWREVARPSPGSGNNWC